jgi:hypothetical protein
MEFPQFARRSNVMTSFVSTKGENPPVIEWLLEPQACVMVSDGQGHR